ncbi:MAG: glycosyltransferase family 39 protein [Anaerolineales bacterium]|nr:glycosyltransferase family 39 protein [Anaerolineales bacterium]
MSSAVKTAGPIDVQSQKRLPWTWSDVIALVVLIGVTILATFELWKPGMQNPGDMLMSVYRIFELDAAWQRGILYPRFGPNLYFGYGAPLFQFYPPLSSYMGILFYNLGFGFIASAKLVLSVNLLLAGLGIYGYLRWLTGRRIGSVTGAILFMFSAYILVVVYERGAVAESTALAIMPWLFWAMHRQVAHRSFIAVCATAILVALLMLAHNISALFMIPVATLYAVLLALHARQYRSSC